VTVTELVAVLGLQMDQAAFKAADDVLHNLKNGALAIGIAVAGAATAVGAMIQSTADAGDELDATSQALGVTTDTLQELRYAAKLSNVGAEELGVGLQQLSRTAREAAENGGDAAVGFQKAGVQIRDSSGHIRPVEDLLGDLADHFKAIPDGTEKTALAMQLMGRSGARMIPVLNGGSEGLAQLSQEAHDLGIVLDQETIAAGADFKDTMDRVDAALTGLKYAIAGPLIHGAADLAKLFVAWVKANREWMATKIHAGIALASGAMKALWAFLQPVFAIFNALVIKTGLWKLALGALALVIAGELGMAIGAAVTAIGGMITSLFTLTAAEVSAALIPIAMGLAWLALAAVVALVAEDIYQFVTGGQSELGDLIAWLDKVDPSDNAFIKLLKSIGSLIFDVTDPKKWAQVGDNLTAVFSTVFDYLKGLVSSALDWIVEKFKAWAPAIGKMLISLLVPGGAGLLSAGGAIAGLFGSGAASPAASAANSSSSTTAVAGGTVNAPITINAAASHDPAAIATSAVDHLDDWHGRMLQSTMAAVSTP
jgi:hypothetical protein